MQPSTSAKERNQLPDAASQTKQTASTMMPMTSPAATTERKYAAGGSQRGTGEASRSAEMPRDLSCTMIPQAHRGTVMDALAMTPTSIQLSQKARTASSAPVTFISSSEASMPSDCSLPRKRTYSASTMRGASREKNTFALSLRKTFRLREVNFARAYIMLAHLPRGNGL